MTIEYKPEVYRGIAVIFYTGTAIHAVRMLLADEGGDIVYGLRFSADKQ